MLHVRKKRFFLHFQAIVPRWSTNLAATQESHAHHIQPHRRFNLTAGGHRSVLRPPLGRLARPGTSGLRELHFEPLAEATGCAFDRSFECKWKSPGRVWRGWIHVDQIGFDLLVFCEGFVECWWMIYEFSLPVSERYPVDLVCSGTLVVTPNRQKWLPTHFYWAFYLFGGLYIFEYNM